ncbi:MAG TPA: GNAT family N-acetyltransferase [Sphingobacteriaceae bacterium]
MYSIEQIAPYNTWAVRHAVLYPDRPFDLVRLDDDADGVHFGLFDQNRLVTVISTFTRGDEMQFRKFATLKEFQGRGYGSAMMWHVLGYAREEGIRKLWCNARTSAGPFYARFGFSASGEHFTKNGIEYVIMSVIV